MTFNEPVVLGRTGLKVGRLGIASGYGAPAAVIEEAFERGANYFTWGTVIKGYRPQMREALKNIVAKGERDKLVLAAFSYAHNNYFTEKMLRRGLKSAGLDRADVLILGYFSGKVPRRLVDGALRMKEKGLVRFIGISSHNRKLLGKLAQSGEFDVLHLRYNAAHPGAEQDIFPFLCC
jgi:predicted aldo/keto reductase-like oxidoreductase